MVANVIGTLFLAPVLLVGGRAIAVLPTKVLWLLVLTGLCQAVYYAALSGAYRNGDLSLAYPMARSLPTVIVALVTQVLGLGENLGVQAFFGIITIVTGALMLPMATFKDFRLRNYLTPTALLSAVAALGTSGYSVIDSEALRLMRTTPDLSLSTVEGSLLYLFLDGIISTLWLCPVVLLRKSERDNLVRVIRQDMRMMTLTGVGINLTYGLVLVAMAFVTNVSYVVVLRQLSIPLGVLLGVAVLREPAHMPRLVGAGLVFLGVVLVGTA
jgi:uncharacterized membrane protein